MNISHVRVKVHRNNGYKASGLKSYVYLLNKYKFSPTLEGPYFRGPKVHHQGKYGAGGLHEVEGASKPIGGRTTFDHHVLQKHIKAAGAGTSVKDTTQAGEVGAEDQQNDSLWLCPVQIGTPAQTLYLDFDTGSSDMWLWSTELPAAQLRQATKAPYNVPFDPKKSSTFKTQTGSSWQIQYGDQSSASGDVGTDNVTLGGLTIKNQSIELAKKMSTEFYQSAGSGLLGLAWGSINTVKPKPVHTPVENMITQKDISASAELFTAYLGSWRDANEADKGESFFTFGYIDQDTLKAANAQPYYTPVDNSQGFWQFASASYSINGTTKQRSANTAIADTGTTLVLVDDATCAAIYKAIPGSKYDSNQQGYVFPAKTTADQLPTVAFAVGNQLFNVQKEDLGFADAGNGMVYGGIQSRGDMPMDILGGTWLKGNYAIFDLGNKRFGCVQRVEQEQNVQVPPSS